MRSDKECKINTYGCVKRPYDWQTLPVSTIRAWVAFLTYIDSPRCCEGCPSLTKRTIGILQSGRQVERVPETWHCCLTEGLLGPLKRCWIGEGWWEWSSWLQRYSLFCSCRGFEKQEGLCSLIGGEGIVWCMGSWSWRRAWWMLIWWTRSWERWRWWSKIYSPICWRMKGKKRMGVLLSLQGHLILKCWAVLSPRLSPQHLLLWTKTCVIHASSQ